MSAMVRLRGSRNGPEQSQYQGGFKHLLYSSWLQLKNLLEIVR